MVGRSNTLVQTDTTIAMKLYTDIHDPQLVFPNDLVDTLTLLEGEVCLGCHAS